MSPDLIILADLSKECQQGGSISHWSFTISTLPKKSMKKKNHSTENWDSLTTRPDLHKRLTEASRWGPLLASLVHRVNSITANPRFNSLAMSLVSHFLSLSLNCPGHPKEKWKIFSPVWCWCLSRETIVNRAPFWMSHVVVPVVDRSAVIWFGNDEQTWYT